MRYVVITAKHHDGFALFDSACSDYDIIDATPFKRDHSESIYGTLANPLQSRPEWGDTNLSKDRKILYLHVMHWPVDGQLTVDGIPSKVKSVAFLSPQAAGAKVDFMQDAQTLKLTLPETAIDAYDTVIRVTLTEPFN
jgi:hypothetical protein